MTIHVLIYTHHWTTGGIEKVILDLAGGLSNRGYSFSILTNDIPDHSRQFPLEGKAKIYFRNFVPFNAKAKAGMRELILKINPDVVITMGSNKSIARLPLVLQGSSIPIIISEHNASNLIQATFKNSQFLRAVRNLADFNHVLLPNYTSDFSDVTNVRIISNPASIDNNGGSNGKSFSKEKKIVCFARYDLKQKQHDVLIKSFAKISVRFPEWKLVLFGSDWKGGQHRILSLAKRLKIGDKVEVNDYTNDVIGEMKTSKILAFPSAFEGCPLVAIDSLAHGLPVVAFSDCEGVNQLVQDDHNGILVPGGVKNVDGFAKALSDLMSDDSKLARLAKNAPATMEQYSIENFLNKWDSLLKEAYAIKGKNILAQPNRMVSHYVEMVANSKFLELKTLKPSPPTFLETLMNKKKRIRARLVKSPIGRLLKRILRP